MVKEVFQRSWNSWYRSFHVFQSSEPVSLGNTWIGERIILIDAEADRISEQGIVIKDVCSHTGSRPPATRLRRKILTILPEIEGS